jgi:hypothetical protein
MKEALDNNKGLRNRFAHRAREGRALAAEELQHWLGLVPADESQVEAALAKLTLSLMPESRSATELRRLASSDKSSAPDAGAGAQKATSVEAEGLADGRIVDGPQGENPGSETDNREASRLLYRLYSEGVRIRLRADGCLDAARPGGLTEEHQEILRMHGDNLKRLLSPEAMSEVWSPAVRYVASALYRRRDEDKDADCEETRRVLNEAQRAYETGDDGAARYRLRLAAVVAAGRVSGVRVPEDRGKSVSDTPSSGAMSLETPGTGSARPRG